MSKDIRRFARRSRDYHLDFHLIDSNRFDLIFLLSAFLPTYTCICKFQSTRRENIVLQLFLFRNINFANLVAEAIRRPSSYKTEIWNFYFKANYTYWRVLTRTSKRFYNLSVSLSLIVKRIERLHQTAFAARFTSREGDSVLRGSLEGFMKISFFSPIYSPLSCFFSIPLVRSFESHATIQ